MEALHAVVTSLTAGELLRGLTVAIVFSRFLSPRSAENTLSPTWKLNKLTEITKTTGFFLLFIFARSWLGLVDHYAPEPYLDEVFHIPQAQTYCEGRFWDWDDKITTPPGLYLLSVASHRLWRLARCTPSSLRNNNVLSILLIALVAALCRDDMEARTAEQREASRPIPGQKKPQSFSLYTCHTALNIALFPVLFFFSGLYYTDVASTLLVLLAYKNHLGRLGKPSPGLYSDFLTVLFGVATLFMRQTNVFWVVVYMGGVEAVHAIRCLKPESEERPPFATLEDQARFCLSRWSVGDIDDPRVDVAWPDDWLVCLLSIAIAALCNPLKILRQVWPHITILALFGGFVAWNGGVVLGDKSNHLATIHLAQMLYIWPFFAFFSAPLFLPTILGFFLSPMESLYTLICGKHRSLPGPRSQRPKSLTLQATNLLSVRKIYYPLYLLLTVVLSLVIVKFNTIIHPFTLADNRHYMFYIFRYTIRRSLKIRYLLVGAYALSRWLVWGRLAGYSDRSCSPINTHILVEGNSSSRKGDTTKEEEENKTLGTLDENNSYSTTPPSTSTVLFWLLTTALSLITAPLVEPRYFILPWVFYRLLVPAWRFEWPSQRPPSQTAKPTSSLLQEEEEEEESTTTTSKTLASASVPASAPAPVGERRPGESEPSKTPANLDNLAVIAKKVDTSLFLETIWFVSINLATMSIFLYKPFYWRDPSSGEVLDGGRVQRFMW